MAILDNIEIRIKSNGRFLDEYNEPDESTTHDLDTTTKYIEATPGAKFSIEVLSIALDSLGKSPYVMICIFDNQSGQWKKALFSFGQVEIVEHDELPDDIDPEKGMQLGTIKLTVYRAHMKRRPVPVAYVKDAGFIPVDQTSEKILKGKAIENNIRYVDGHVIPQPSPHTHDYSAMKGWKGKPLIFTFHYRSHRALQILGCIPRPQSPAIIIHNGDEADERPAPDAGVLSDTESEISQRAQERARLQASLPLAAELARLDRLDQAAHGIKHETGSLRDSNSPSNLKRERDDNGVRIKVEGAATRKRPRTSGPIETVDLTED
ncbi:hypothetical protein MMC16_002426 [Acarospora aff. strigata]|nr:hypothetical protein [Acarospora aff. strigata]